jgi:hypothetical protein
MSIFKRLFGGKPNRSERPISAPIPPIKTHKQTPNDSAAYRLGMGFMREYISKGGPRYGSQLKLSSIEHWQAIKAESKAVQTEICVYAADHIFARDYINEKIGRSKTNESGWVTNSTEVKLASTLMRSKLSFSDAQLARMIAGCTKRRSLDWENPIRSVMSAVERHIGDKQPDGELKLALLKLLEACDKRSQYSDTDNVRKIKVRVDALLEGKKRGHDFSFPKGAFSNRVKTDLDALTEKEQINWSKLMKHAFSASASKPSKKWLNDAKPLTEAIGLEAFQTQFIIWASDVKPDPADVDYSLKILKGLVWIASSQPNDTIALAIGRLAEVSFVKVAGIGARSKKLGNACCVSLMNMAENGTAIAELVRLRGKIKYPSVKESIQKKLENIAEKQGVSSAELEDSSLPDFGFKNGVYVQRLGDFTATIHLFAQKANLEWSDKDGKVRKTVPTDIRKNFKTKLEDLKQKTKNMTAMISGQTIALEQSYLADRSWEFATWKRRYVDHPVRVKISENLIWFITDGPDSYAVLPTKTGLQTADGTSVKPSKTAAVRLWHPLFETTDTILSWRKRIEDLRLTQPFKQAHREIYVVTDAERNTDVYSNRFAAHILRQHQFKALCDAKQWRYTLQGLWDSWNRPNKHLPAFNITAEFAVEIISEDDRTDAWIPLYLSSDQVRFSSPEQNPLPIEQVPPLVFSEIMRDVDLFVSVTSVANDPTWADGGPEGRFGGYWREHAFGELGQTAKVRKELIETILPKLAIADKCEIEEKYLVVRGKRNSYKIHFGSGNIMIMPDNRYLCIVKGGKHKSSEKVYLPFAGDNLLSIILSKAFLLVDDHKITDRTILSQL